MEQHLGLKLSGEQIESIRKSFVRSRLILFLLLGGIMAAMLFGINSNIESGELVMTIVGNVFLVGIFSALWFRGYRNHQKIMKGLPDETYTVFEGKIENATSGGGSVMFTINGMKHRADYTFGKYCIKGNRVRLFKTDKSEIVFDVQNM